MQRAELADRLKAMGVVGAGGAGFPTHVKLASACRTVIINGAECEPLLESDKHLLHRETERILDALALAVAACGAERGVVAVKGRYKQVVTQLREAAASRTRLSVHELENYYPAGDEHSVVREVTGVSVPPLGLPLNVGCIVQNVETMRNVGRAVEGIPVTSRFLTCGGAVARPAIVEARIGISFRTVIEACGGALPEEYVILAGGPMMGTIVRDIDTPVTKLTSGLIVLPADHRLVAVLTQEATHVIRQSKTACCQCTYCTELCPRYLLGHNLEPHKIMRQINLGLDIPAAVIEGALLCSECGVCETVACTMDLSPRLMNRIIKERLRAAGYKADFSGQPAVARDMWPYRKVPTSRVLSRLGVGEYDVHPAKVVSDLAADRVELPLKQHIGAPATAVVAQGDRVRRGDLVGEIPAAALGARIHASIDGEVVLVDKERIIIEKRRQG